MSKKRMSNAEIAARIEKENELAAAGKLENPWIKTRTCPINS